MFVLTLPIFCQEHTFETVQEVLLSVASFTGAFCHGILLTHSPDCRSLNLSGTWTRQQACNPCLTQFAVPGCGQRGGRVLKSPRAEIWLFPRCGPKTVMLTRAVHLVIQGSCHHFLAGHEFAPRLLCAQQDRHSALDAVVVPKPVRGT